MTLQRSSPCFHHCPVAVERESANDRLREVVTGAAMVLAGSGYELLNKPEVTRDDLVAAHHLYLNMSRILQMAKV